MQGLLWKIGTIPDAIWYTWKNVQWDRKLEHLKIITNEHQHTKTSEDEKAHILNNE